jgi:hypothetical protein
MRRPDYDEDLAFQTRSTSVYFYDEADRRHGVVDSLKAVQEAAEAGEPVPEGLLEAAEGLRSVLFGPSGIQGVGDAARDAIRTDSPVRKLRMLGSPPVKPDKARTG